MNLEKYGYNATLSQQLTPEIPAGLEPGRILAEHKERYIVACATGELDAEITGNLRFTARSREDFPAVGDWVALTPYDDFALIHAVLPRRSLISRQLPGHAGEVQVIAANVDVAFLLQAADRDFSPNRLERYLTLCHTGKVKPVIVLTKTDLAGEELTHSLSASLRQRIPGTPVVALSNATREGYEALAPFLGRGITGCLLGSSGVGKSTLLNNLAGHERMKTGVISESIDRGRHVTTHRELIVLENGGILIDNPGMREVGITDSEGGLEATFAHIADLSKQCRFNDCRHIHEAGCAVIEAVSRGEIDPGAYENYLRLEREKDHFEATLAERRRKDKQFGKMVKEFKKRKEERQ
ncbi:MAG TPA: ribosome small subunit-dependent GTPase A [Bacteroidales bacterium]|nr:ribosome small subunit-dependent GTPase A [Bacteroidales bacterium]